MDILQLEPPPYCLPKGSNPPLSSFLPPSLESHFKVREKTSWQKKRGGWRGEGRVGRVEQEGEERLGGRDWEEYSDWCEEVSSECRPEASQ